MYSIALQQNQYDTYILSDRSSGARMEVVPERGGIITQWDINGTSILYLDTERFSDPTKSVRGGIPILFPICGNLPDDSYQINAQTYRLKQHGFARDLPWVVSDRGVESEGAMLQLTLESTEDTRLNYPFDFQLQFTYRLKGNSIILEQRFTNRSEQPMPFSTGQHPYFQVEATAEAKSKLQLDIPAVQYNDNVSKRDSLGRLRHRTYNNDFDWAAPEIDAAFRPVSAQQATVVDPTRQVRLTLSYDKPYSTLVFWSVQGKDFYCLEPWSAPRNALNTGTDLITLAPGASEMLTTTYTVQLSNE
jgi:galactose mutarotase-like enzyme